MKARYYIQWLHPSFGWTVLRVTPKHIKTGQAFNWIEKLVAQHGR